jgi:hypothetical protein
MTDEAKQGTGDAGWRPEEKGPDASGNPGDVHGDAGAAGEAEAKGRPDSGRDRTEAAAAAPPKPDRHDQM